MYNEENKRRFILERSGEAILPNNYLECQFNKVESMEIELQKDVSNFTVYEIIEYYKMLNLTSAASLSVMNSQFSIYTQWCLQKNLVTDNQNHFLEISPKDINECVNRALFDMSIITRENVLEWVNEIINPRDQFILLALFEGIKGKDFCEIVKLKPEDVNGNIAKLCTGRQVEISDKLVSVIQDCLSENIYYSVSGKNKKTMPLIDNGYIVKSYPNIKNEVDDFQNGRRIYNSITRILKYFDTHEYMSANSISESGKLHMIKRKSQELGMTCEEYISSGNISEVEKQYDCVITKSIYMMKYKSYLE